MPPPKVLLISARMGAGHDLVAAELAQRLAEAGCDTQRVDYLDLSPEDGAKMRATYRRLIRWAPWMYGASMALWQRWPSGFGSLMRFRTRRFDAGLAQAIAESEPEVVVSTYNLASLSLGRLAAGGAVPARTVTYVTDPGAHPYWVHPAIDLHLAVHPLTAARLSEMGAREVVTVEPVVRPEAVGSPERSAECRAALGLPARGRVVLVNAGSWGAGRVLWTVRALAGLEGVTVAVLCGRSESLHARMAAEAGVQPIGWLDDMSVALSAADVLVDNAGGLTYQEAAASGLPVVTYQPLPGHGMRNARTLAESGAAPHAETALELRRLVTAAAPVPGPAEGPRPDAVAEILRMSLAE